MTLLVDRHHALHVFAPVFVTALTVHTLQVDAVDDAGVVKFLDPVDVGDAQLDAILLRELFKEGL